MDQVVVISGVFTGAEFVPDGPLPAVEGRAELVVHVPATSGKRGSVVDVLGKADHLCSAEEARRTSGSRTSGVGRSMIYADSGVIMRWVEGAQQIRSPVFAAWMALSVEERVFATSRLSKLECCCKPLRDGDTKLLTLYHIFFDSLDVRLYDVDADVIDAATECAKTGLKTPDAIHLATAELAGAIELWTTDIRLSRVQAMPIRLFPS